MSLLCVETGCLRSSAPDRRRCHAHSKAKWRRENKVMAQYSRLKAKAKARRIEFALSIEDFTEFACETGYCDGVGCGSPSDLQCDRIDARRGYTRENIQALAFADNARKGASERFGHTLVGSHGTMEIPF